MLKSLNFEENNKKLFNFIKRHYDLNDKTFMLIEENLKNPKDYFFKSYELTLEHQYKIDTSYSEYIEKDYKSFRKEGFKGLFSQFPKDLRKLYFVITNDPSQMVFQSTGYKWCTCTSFQRIGAVGLPQTLLNKSKAQFFITDGKLIEYEGILYYRVFNYGDLLNSKDNKMFFSKHIVSYIFGVVNCVAYGYVAYKMGFYGDFIINIFYFLPFQFIGFAWWKNHHIETNKNIVKSKVFTFKGKIIIAGLSILGFVIFTNILYGVDHFVINAMKRNSSMYGYFQTLFNIPYIGEMLDASTEVFQIIAQILLSFAFAEQWIFWILTNIIAIFMWSVAIYIDPSTAPWAIPTLITWIAFLVNSFYGMYMWYKKE